MVVAFAALLAMSALSPLAEARTPGGARAPARKLLGFPDAWWSALAGGQGKGAWLFHAAPAAAPSGGRAAATGGQGAGPVPVQEPAARPLVTMNWGPAADDGVKPLRASQQLWMDNIGQTR
ncbi:hypothetical protein MNEG_3209 [Monoraphidium neglectum]|uniref:Uncharacterized protein n=1 Tax=Monoraphidium neglectum TaxID=145388 RepID=A0A0D2MWA1_9CHLO|nr:hypothetical protein MNEG_3209 [Monoraphidium neglectum]KIZ04752.1 hypothetical protein MNEG_3209 [Monoraphidium neglectum]|eukprot:XP_013903771.1 hypothetical protein MNEG_3209 [Monoraphidium neglectum]